MASLKKKKKKKGQEKEAPMQGSKFQNIEGWFHDIYECLFSWNEQFVLVIDTVVWAVIESFSSLYVIDHRLWETMCF